MVKITQFLTAMLAESEYPYFSAHIERNLLKRFTQIQNSYFIQKVSRKKLCKPNHFMQQIADIQAIYLNSYLKGRLQCEVLSIKRRFQIG